MKIKNRNVETAPFVEVIITHKGKIVAQLNQHWTANKGCYGWQVCSRQWMRGEYSEHATNGCGYSKEASDLGRFLAEFRGGYFRGCGGHDASSFFRGVAGKAGRGGNYYEITARTLARRLNEIAGD